MARINSDKRIEFADDDGDTIKFEVDDGYVIVTDRNGEACFAMDHSDAEDLANFLSKFADGDFDDE